MLEFYSKIIEIFQIIQYTINIFFEKITLLKKEIFEVLKYKFKQ